MKEPVKLNLINAEKAQQLIAAVENGKMSIQDAIKLVEDLVESTPSKK